jgi:hypothetical protein
MRSLFLSLVSLLILGPFLLGAPPASQAKAHEKETAIVLALIDKLVEAADNTDLRYYANIEKTSFFPLDWSDAPRRGPLLKPSHVDSDTLREIVKHGAAAVPHLLAHLRDRRPTRIKVLMEGFGFDSDTNPRTDAPIAPPEPVDEDGRVAYSKLTSYRLTVGDLCFVALGQIVNRRYDPLFLFPLSLPFIRSPAHSPFLDETIKRRWGALTPERHKASLLADFLKPDSEERRIGACKRLAYYYPQALEPLALRFLRQPTYDRKAVNTFVRETLYPTSDPRKRRAAFDTFVSQEARRLAPPSA